MSHQQALEQLSKGSLVVVCRQLGVRGDFARMSKGEMVARILAAEQAEASGVLIVDAAVSHLPVAQIKRIGSPRRKASVVAAAPVAVPASIAPVAPAAPAGAVFPSCIGQKTAAEVFGVDLLDRAGNPVMVDVWNDPLSPTAAVMKDYVFDRENLRLCLSAVRNGWNFWMGGPASTGKTEWAVQFAARTGRSLFRVSFDGTMERAELFGDVGLRDGSTVFEPGIILQGMQRPGAVILLDELSNMRPEFAASLHPVLEPGGSYRVTRTGEVFKPAPGVVWFAADNSMGGGDYTGQFAGLKQLNGATRSRFIKCAFTYLPESAEAKLVAGRTGTPHGFCRQLVDFVSKCRVASTVGEIELPPTLRQVIPMAGMIRDGIEPRTALAACVLADQSPAGAEKVNQLWAANVSEEKLLAALLPKPKGAAPDAAAESAADALRREVMSQA